MSNETTTNVISERLVHVHIGGFSISITKTDEGVVADIWESGFEGDEALNSTYSFDSELHQSQQGNE